MVATTNKTERFEIRVNSNEKEVVERAATMMGLSLSAYMRSCIVQKAKEDISKQENLILSDRDRDIFLNALEDSTPSTGRLKSALTKFRQTYGKA